MCMTRRRSLGSSAARHQAPRRSSSRFGTRPERSSRCGGSRYDGRKGKMRADGRRCGGRLALTTACAHRTCPRLPNGGQTTRRCGENPNAASLLRTFSASPTITRQDPGLPFRINASVVELRSLREERESTPVW
jgi:hypothetical protein